MDCLSWGQLTCFRSQSIAKHLSIIDPLYPDLPAIVHSTWTHQVNTKLLLATDGDFSIDLGCIHKTLLWRKIIVQKKKTRPGHPHRLFVDQVNLSSFERHPPPHLTATFAISYPTLTQNPKPQRWGSPTVSDPFSLILVIDFDF